MKFQPRIIILLFGLWSAIAVQGEPARYSLDMRGHDPKAGDEGERTVQVVFTYNSTNTTAGRTSTSNSLQLVELKGREKVLSWDVSNDVSKVAMVVERFVKADATRTNELLASGSELAGRFLAGESFFRVGRGALTAEVQQLLAQDYNIRPRKFNLFAQTRFPPSVSVGETWKLGTPLDADALHFLGVSFTNNVEATGQLAGVTNLSGIDCFHVRFQVETRDTPKFLREMFGPAAPIKFDLRVRLTADLIVPFDERRRLLQQKVFMEIGGTDEVGTDGNPKLFGNSRATMLILDEFRPLLRP